MEYELNEDEEPEVKDNIMETIKKNDPFELRLKSIESDNCNIKNLINK